MARKICFDIDYRPNLWGLAGHGAGEERYIKSDKVSDHIKTVLPDCDLIVGTEEEVHIAAGSEDTLTALKTIRSLSPATIVLKRGPMGCVVYPGCHPRSIWKRASSARDFPSRSTTCWVRAMPSSPASCAAG